MRLRRLNGGDRRWLVGVLAVVSVLGALMVVLVLAPPWFVPGRSLEALEAQNDVRTTLLQGVGGAAVLVGAYFTWRQLQTSREGQITERFTRAIDQLGNNQGQLHVVTGGIYALERIARDSASDRAAIADILTAYVRAHAPWLPTRPGTYVADAPLDELPDLQVRAPEVQAILTVLGREAFADYVGRPFNLRLDVEGEAPIIVNPEVPPWAFEGDLEPHLAERGGRFDLRATDLRCASLSGADLHGANLSEAHLEGANLIGARLAGANLTRAHLRRASLVNARMERADLFLANLNGALLGGAHLEHARLLSARLIGADLSGAHLRGADLGGAHLQGSRLLEADLAGADLSSAKLERAGLFGATADSMTAWPEGFDLHAAGVRLRDEGQSDRPTRSRPATKRGPGRSRRLFRGPRRV